MSEVSLNENQKQAVEYDGGPLLIIAGAGTGKTTVITKRIEWLITQKGLKPEEILALTFTEKAAQEMEERVDMILPFGYTQTWIMTFHGFCERIVRAEGIHIGLDPSFDILSEAETQLFIRDHLFDFDLSYFRPQGNPTKFIGGLITHFSRLKDDAITPDEYIEWVKGISDGGTGKEVQGKSGEVKGKGEEGDAKNKKSKSADDESQVTNYGSEDIAKYRELANAYQTYERLKIENSVMDFSDLISQTVNIFTQRPNVLASYQKKFKAILVDEFQDTNYAQNHLAIMLAGMKKNITVVCDDDQAIYRWRGAAVYNVLDFKKHFPEAKFITLTDNYRSSQQILDASYNLIQHNNPDRLESQENISKKLKSHREDVDSKICVLWEETVEDEAGQVAREIERIVEKTKGASPNESVGFNDIAILVRANAHAEPFTRAFSRLGIPYQFLGPGRLFRQEEVKDLIAYCRFLTNPADDVSLYRVLASPTINIPGKDIQWLLSNAKGSNNPLFKVIEDDATENEKLEKFRSMVHRHMDEMKRHSPGEVLYHFLEDTGELSRMREIESQFEERRVENISAFFNRVKAFEVQHPESHISDFTEYINFLVQAGESPLASQIDWSETNAVKILTVHSAKGLEFETVFVVNVVDKRFPTINRHDQIPLPDEIIKEPEPVNDPHIAEERRLFYVAVTRAKKNLFITGAKFYHDSETVRAKKLSPFVHELLGENLESYMESSVIKHTPLDMIDSFVRTEETNKEISTEVQKPESDRAVTYLSYSQIETFDTCPLHYKLSYVLKIPTLSSGALTFGTVMHDTLRDVYRQKILKTVTADIIQHAEELYDLHWSPSGFDSKEHEMSRYEAGKEILKNFIAEDYHKTYEVVKLEEPFTFRLTQDLKVGGRIDRIQRLSDGTLEIIDYKTGQVPPERELITGIKGLQLSMYALAATEVLGEKLENVLLSFYYLETGEKISMRRTSEDLVKAKEKIIAIKEQIEQSDFLCSNSYICQQGCEYDLFCG